MRCLRKYGTGETPAWGSSTSPVHGTTANGEEVTVSFGTGNREGHTYISDGHIDRASDFVGQDRYSRKHNHYGPGNYGKDGENAKDRGFFTGDVA